MDNGHLKNFEMFFLTLVSTQKTSWVSYKKNILSLNPISFFSHGIVFKRRNCDNLLRYESMILDAIFHYVSEEHVRATSVLPFRVTRRSTNYMAFHRLLQAPLVISYRIRFDRMAIVATLSFHFSGLWLAPKTFYCYTYSGLKITAGHRTMTGQKCLLTGHFFTSPVILTATFVCLPIEF